MTSKQYLVLAGFFIMILTGCSKPDDNVSLMSDTDLLIRRWSFPEITVKTNAKSYTASTSIGPIISDDNTLTIQKDGVYTYLENGKSMTGKWVLTNKTLTLTNADSDVMNMTITNLTSTDLELVSIDVDVTKSKDFTDSKVYTTEEQAVGVTAYILLGSLDKQNGGSIDFTKESEPKRIQLIMKGKAK